MGERSQSFLTGASRWLVTLAVVLSPWLFGSADPWAFLLVGLVAGAGIAVFLFSLVCSPDPTVRAPELTVALGLLAAFLFLQAVPMPASLVDALNPLSARIQREGMAVLGRLPADPDGAPLDTALSFASLSASASTTRRSLVLLLVYAGTFVVLANTVQSRSSLRRTAVVIVVSGFVMAVLAMIHRFSGSHQVYWFHTPRYGGNVCGPFSNRNHFAAHMNMLVGVALALLLSSSHFGEVIGWPRWRERIAWLSTKRASQIALSAFAVMLMSASMCLSMSRGAMSSFVVAVGLTAAISGSRRSLRERSHVLLGAVAILVLGGVVWLGWRPVLERLGSLRDLAMDPFSDWRPVVWGDTLQMFGAHPLLGCGFGTFHHVFPMFQSPDLDWRWMHAHSDWVQLLAEGGLAGTTLFLAALFLWTREVTRRLPHAPETMAFFVYGLLVSLLAVALHSFVDYGLHRPANALLAAAIAGMAVSTLHLPEGRLRGRRGTRRVPKAAVRLVSLALLSGAVLLLVAMHREWRGELAYVRLLHLEEAARKARSRDAHRATMLGACEEADFLLRHAGNNADALLEAGVTLLKLATDRRTDPETHLVLARKGNRLLVRSVQNAPSDYLGWLWLARLQASVRAWEDASASLERAKALTGGTHEVRLFRTSPGRRELPREPSSE